MVTAGLAASGILGITKALAEYQKRKPRVFYITGKPPAVAPFPHTVPSYPHSARPASFPPQDLTPYVVAGAIFGAL